VRLKIWGCRGSVPAPGSDTAKYGGNTSCVEVALDEGTALVLDAGTGIRALGLDLVARGTQRIHLFLTHLHLDHLEGLRFFAPLWDERVAIEIWGPRSPVLSLRDRILRSFSPPLFPLDFRDVPARVTFHDLPGEPWRIGGITLTADLVLHPGPTLGFRVETEQASLAYLPDHEPALAGIE
jgi:phosphoribosyl 1,2-cyclic phosphodiesterase